MIYGKLPTTLLFLLSFVVLAIGGYQCATKTMPERTTAPIQNEPGGNGGWGPNPGQGGKTPYSDDEYLYPPGYGQDSGWNRGENLPPDPGNRCARAQYRNLSGKYGEMGIFKFDSSSIEDYLLGKKTNFGLNCGKIYLDMDRLSGTSQAYKGTLTIAFEDGRNVRVIKYQSGWNKKENKYNRWTGTSWSPDSNDRVSKKFYAIFEDKDTAIILRLEDIRVDDLRDGQIGYLGAGDIYYKMFRMWVGDTSDVCYSKGNYARYANHPANRDGRCWLLGTGPYSCRPNGALAPGARVTDINIRGSLKCYSRLGSFYGLDIKEAFNVGNVSELN